MPLTIFKRLVIGNILVLILVLLLGAVISFNLKNLQKLNHEVVAKNQESIFVGGRVMDAFNLLVQFDEKYFVAKDTDYFKRFNEQKTNLKGLLNTYSLLMETTEQKRLLDQTIQTFDNYLNWFKKTAEAQTQKIADFDRLVKERNPYLQVFTKNLGTILILSREIITKKTKQFGQRTHQIFIVTIITTILTVIVGLVITILNTRSIRNSVTRLQKKTKEISQGHFEPIQTFKGPKEIQNLALHFNTMCQRLKELDELKADFISHVSHELKTPITSIKEASTILSKGFYDNDPGKQKKILNLIHEECQRLLRSVMRILDYSKMEARKMEYQTVRLDLPDVIRKSILKLAPLSLKKKIFLEFFPPQQDLPKIRGDEDKIIEVLDNIVGNALKFTPSGGRIKVSCRCSKNKLTVVVEDNGPGIQPEHLKKIFDKFKQIDNDLNTRMGTGLGLSISKYIIKAHGGEIWAQSQVAKGTKILFTLPAVS